MTASVFVLSDNALKQVTSTSKVVTAPAGAQPVPSR
jgi:hypothetical protein